MTLRCCFSDCDLLPACSCLLLGVFVLPIRHAHLARSSNQAEIDIRHSTFDISTIADFRTFHPKHLTPTCCFVFIALHLTASIAATRVSIQNSSALTFPLLPAPPQCLQRHPRPNCSPHKTTKPILHRLPKPMPTKHPRCWKKTTSLKTFR